MTGQSDIEVVRDATDLVRLIGEHVALRPKGREHVGLCPFHDDKNPSLAVVTHKGNAFYKCHSCGAGGDAFDFVIAYHRMDFAEALRYLADRAGVTLQPRKRDFALNSDQTTTKRTDLKKANAFAATYFRRVLADPTSGASARQVIEQRAISDEMVEAFMIGAAPDQWDGLLNRIRKQSLSEDIFLAAGLLKPRKESISGSSAAGNYDAFRNRLIFPICDKLGNPIAFGARKIDPEDEPKYLNSAESPLFSKSKTLYGLHRANRAIIESRQAIVTEGYTDVIACHQAGITNVVGTLGTALTREHARDLSRLCDTVVLVFDGDEAGQKAADRGLVEVFCGESVDVKICVLPGEYDPDELLREPDGLARFQEALQHALDIISFKARRLLDQLAPDMGPSAKRKRLEAFLADLVTLGFAWLDPIRGSRIANDLDTIFGMPLGTTREMLNTVAHKNKRGKPGVAAAAVTTSGSKYDDFFSPRQRAERDLLSILLYQPEVALDRLRFEDGSSHLLSDLLQPTDFTDLFTSEVAGVLFERLATNRVFTVQQIRDDLRESPARDLVLDLYVAGEILVESCPTEHTTALCHAITALQDHINLDQYHQTVSTFNRCKDSPDQALLAAQNVIEQRRRQGHLAAAIGRGARS